MEPIEIMKRIYKGIGRTWPKDWIDLNIEVGNSRKKALEETIEMLLDEGEIGNDDQGPAYAALDNYLSDHGMTDKAWLVLMAQELDEVTFTKRLNPDGGGYKVHVDVALAEALGVAQGDYVELTMKRAS